MSKRTPAAKKGRATRTQSPTHSFTEGFRVIREGGRLFFVACVLFICICFLFAFAGKLAGV